MEFIVIIVITTFSVLLIISDAEINAFINK